jgi:hypothetical protein
MGNIDGFAQKLAVLILKHPLNRRYHGNTGQINSL